MPIISSNVRKTHFASFFDGITEFVVDIKQIIESRIDHHIRLEALPSRNLALEERREGVGPAPIHFVKELRHS